MLGKSQNKYWDNHQHTKNPNVLVYEAEIYVIASIRKTNFINILWLFDLSQKLKRQ